MALSADIYARALIAAAAAYKLDPIVGLTCRDGYRRRYVAPAGWGIVAATGARPRDVFNALGMTIGSAGQSIKFAQRNPCWKTAAEAAEAAVLVAMKGHAVGAVSLDQIAAPAAPEPVLRIPVEFDEPQLPASGAAPVLAVVPKTAERLPPAPAPEFRPLPTIHRAPIQFQAKSPRSTWATQETQTVIARIREALGKRPMSAMSLASMLDVKESVVSADLRILEHAGDACPGPTPEAGARHRLWALTEEGAIAC